MNELIKILKNKDVGSFYYQSGTVKYKYGDNRLYHIMSISKLLVNLAIGVLVDKKLISPSDNVSKWLPEYPHITILDLLKHKSGIDATWDGSGKKIFSRARNRKLGHKKYQYNNFGPAILMMIVDSINPAIKLYADIFKKLDIKKYKLFTDINPLTKRAAPIGSFGVYLSAADLCKLSRPFLDNVLVSRKWINKTIKEKLLLEKFGSGYIGHSGTGGQVLAFRQTASSEIIIVSLRVPRKNDPADMDIIGELKNITRLIKDNKCIKDKC